MRFFSSVPEPVSNVPKPVIIINSVPQPVVVELEAGPEGGSCQEEAVGGNSNVYRGIWSIPVLTDNNYVQWRDKVISALKFEGLWDIVMGEELYSGTDVSARDEFIERSECAWRLIFLRIPWDTHPLESVYSAIFDTEDPARLWKVIISYYECDHVPVPVIPQETIVQSRETVQSYDSVQSSISLYASMDHSYANSDSAVDQEWVAGTHIGECCSPKADKSTCATLQGPENSLDQEERHLTESPILAVAPGAESPGLVLAPEVSATLETNHIWRKKQKKKKPKSKRKQHK